METVGANVLVKIVYEQNKGDIIIPDTAMKFKKYDGDVYGEVMAIGPESIFRDKLQKGDKIRFVRNEGKAFPYKGAEYRRLSDKWVLSKL